MTVPPRPEELLQKGHQVAYNPKWPFGSRAPLEKAQRDVARNAGGIPHAVHIADVHGDAHGKYDREPSYSFGPRGRSASTPSRRGLEVEGCQSPGPGGYLPMHSQTMVSAPKCGFGSSQSKRGCSALLCSPFDPSNMYRGLKESPGPAVYDTRKVRDNGPKYTMGVRAPLTKKGTSNEPAPGTYRPESAPGGKPKVSGGNWGTGQPTRPQRPKSAGPGPGVLHGNLGKSGPRYSIGARPMEPRPPSRGRKLGLNYTQFG
eukprot:CAMPEP_0195120096 /NCGR_PEP_ID=MMETSP0448-20130528/121043_1 /TAXON_ID=66468 /ORGANISM="Heterocapsa triquestra, Strain CCMP 448" /LENGTH=258 /DNA_ID=CAMNT_0040157487 /DNA_START=10 /DNA_END=783 /DNA_ORIENTATION=-